MTNNTVGVISLGCAKNLVDTERMLGILRASGFEITNDPKAADILIVNTCGFIEPAKQESIDTILELAQYKKNGRCKTLVATGCLAERYRSELLDAMPEIDLLLGVREYEKLPELLHGRAISSCTDLRVLTTPPYRAFLRIGDGCNNRCAYCAIPLIRGPLVSTPMEDLLAEANRLADGGVTELTVIAQDTSGYGKDLYGRPRLQELLQKMAEIPALHWVRVLYTYPDTVTPELIDLLKNTEKLIPYLDIPLQHIDDTLLLRMHRRGSSDHIKRVLDHVRKTAPDCMLRTTMMVGFPGETDAQFEALLAFLRDYPFDRVGAFAFSPEEGTPAADMPDQISEEIKQERLDRLMAQQRTISARRNASRVGSTAELLIESVGSDLTTGRTYAEAPDVDGVVRIPSRKGFAPGQYIPIRLTGAGDYDMMGEPL